MKKLYSLYHINTNFSSINPSQFKNLINNSYNKLLDLIENNDYNISVEASAKSLIDLNKADHKIISRLKYLISKKKCSFVASGYVQLIMPIVPYELNKKNLEIGENIYKKLLGINPKIFYINEQTFSKSLIKLLKKYNKIILEYNNSNLKAKNKIHDAYEINTINDDYDNKIDVIWNDHIFFQKFQRLIYGEISQDDYLNFIKKFKFSENSYLPLYGSDVECFGFSPNRYKSEPSLINSHWKNIEAIYKKLENLDFKHFNLYDLKKKKKSKSYKITTIHNPIIVKKQAKYNVTRWCLTGRNDLKINTFCWRMYGNLKEKKIKKIKKWELLCELWSSDLRTHVTKWKWNNAIKIFKKNNQIRLKLNNHTQKNKQKIINKNDLEIKNKNLILKINTKKGFSIKSLNKKNMILGHIEQGLFNSNRFDVDFFSGHSILEYEKEKITDIGTQYKKYYLNKKFNKISYIVKKGMGKFLNYKKISILSNKEIELENSFKNIPDSSLRTFYLTFDPKLFNKNNLYIKTHNGGNELEKFYIKNKNFDYGERVSNIVSSNTTLGSTKNILILGDKKKEIIIKIDRNYSAIMPMISYQSIDKSYLLRIFFSCCETDETSINKILNFSSKISLKIKEIN